MSDGNFNRALLPKHELSAGIRAGKAQMRTRAEQAFIKTVSELLPHLTSEQQQVLHDRFMQHLRTGDPPPALP